jgi:NhaP-type Na+/H+ or K+/H+ antiporter
MFASFNVLVSTAAFIPLMLYGLNLAAAGWRPVDAALFGAMLGSTDAVAVTAILKAGVQQNFMTKFLCHLFPFRLLLVFG